MSNPLITFFVCAYNQEQFIREAVEGAFAQTYSPLEIVLSDDCSPDRTFEIMRQMAAAYRGPHQVALNRNERNLRLGAHLNKIVALSRGEILVGAAGDDISFKNRTERIYNAWIESSGTAFSIYSSMIEIDGSGAQKGLWNNGVPIHPASLSAMLGRKQAGLYGFSQAFHRKVYDVFGPMDDRLLYECVAIPFRSLLLGTIKYIPEPLGYYRRHATNTWVDPYTTLPTLTKRRQVLRTDRAYLVTWLRDLRKASVLGMLSDEESEELQTEVVKRLYENGLESKFYESPLPASLLVLCREYFELAKLKHMLRILKRSWQSQRAAPEPVAQTPKPLYYDSVGKMRRLEDDPKR
jgi:glycosyltransferase involved in cell wall biosynthesis